MIRRFRHKGLEKFFFKGSLAGIQPDHARKLRLILGRLNASEKPEDMNLPGLRLHSLSGDLEGFWAVSVNANWRITFRFEQSDTYDVNYEDYH